MAYFIKKFNTTQEYNTYMSGDNLTPNVCLTNDDYVVHFNKKIDYSKEYLTFKALESGTFTLTIPSTVDTTYMTSVSYSTDNGETWTTTAVNTGNQTITTPTIAQGDKVLWKGEGSRTSKSVSTSKSSIFSSTGNFNVSGNAMSLLYGDNFVGQTAFENNSTTNFAMLFNNCTKLVSAENLILPATTVNVYSYNAMFKGCTSLTTAPELPAVTLAQQCYGDMFNGCTSLTTAPSILPATNLGGGCYADMFNGCTSLTTAPTIPSQINSYNYCFQNMYKNCSSLNSITVLITRNNGLYVFSNWVQGVASSGTFTKASSLSLPTGDSGIPANWTVVNV